jgi:DNA-binding CsgD family transcriptional regulator
MRGREGEAAALERLIDAARTGASGAVLVVGEAGIGKTALLAAATPGTEGMHVLRARGFESEAELAFSALHSLVRPLSDDLAAIPAVQAGALRAALAMAGADGAPDRLTVSVGTLSLIAAAAERAPILIVVDDAHAIDTASAEALAFAARRLEADRVAIVLAARDDARGAFAGIDNLVLGPLTVEAAGLVLRDRFEDIATEVAGRIARASGGNPLLLIEIADALTPDQLRGRSPIGDLLPSAGAAASLLRSRVAGLPAGTMAALLVAAASETGDAGEIRAALGRSNAAATGLDEAGRADLVTVSEGRVAFTSELARSAVYNGATLEERDRAHEALAAVTEADQRAWHRAAATHAPDESVAADLEQTAHRARRRAGYAAAERALLRAAAVSERDDDRSRRLIAAAEMAWGAGHIASALGHLDEAAAVTGDERLRQAARHLRGRIAARAGAALDAHALLAAEADRLATTDPATAAEMYAEAVLPCLRDGATELAVASGRRARELAPAATRAAMLADLALGTALMMAGVGDEGRTHIDAAATAAGHDGSAIDDPIIRSYLGLALRLADEGPRARAVLAAVIAEARAASAPGVLPYALARQASIDLEAGRFGSAASALDEAVRLAEATGQAADLGIALGAVAWLDAVQGRQEACRSHAAAAAAIASDLGPGSRFDMTAAALGMLELGHGRLEAAAAVLAEADRVGRSLGFSDATLWPHRAPDLVEALARGGRADEAAGVLEAFRADVDRAGRASARAALLRCAGLLADDGAFDEPFRAALELPGISPFEQARASLCYGERLRRARRRVEGRELVRAAHESFVLLGADPWAERAAAELRASGESVRKRADAEVDALTPGERQIALLVAEGLTNKEVAAHLFVTPKTVEFHLSNVFRKLGVRSRTELARAMG